MASTHGRDTTAASPTTRFFKDFSLVSAERENSYFNLEILLFLLLNLILYVPVSSEARVPKHLMIVRNGRPEGRSGSKNLGRILEFLCAIFLEIVSEHQGFLSFIDSYAFFI